MTSLPSDGAPPRPPSALSGDDLALRYGARTVVDGVALRLEAGRVTALVGPNGSGKSTVLRALARLHPLAGGAVELAAGSAPARSVALLRAREFAREVTLFAQSRPAPAGLAAEDVVAFGRHPYRRGLAGLSAVDRAAVDRAMAITGVHRMAGRAVGELSGGELQRVWLAACLAQDTGVVLLDEPTNHLDLRYQVETLDLVRELAEEHGVAVGIVLHDLDHAARVADELLLLAAGRVHAAGTPLEVLTAENISAVYEIPVEVTVDPAGRLRIDALGRRAGRAHPEPHAAHPVPHAAHPAPDAAHPAPDAAPPAPAPASPTPTREDHP